MKKMILAAALALAAPAWGQAPEKAPAKAAAAQDAPKAAAKPMARKASPKRHQDARHCLQRGDNDAIIRCAEEYL